MLFHLERKDEEAGDLDAARNLTREVRQAAERQSLAAGTLARRGVAPRRPLDEAEADVGEHDEPHQPGQAGVEHLQPRALELVVDLAEERVLDVGGGVVLPLDRAGGAHAHQRRRRSRRGGVGRRRSSIWPPPCGRDKRPGRAAARGRGDRAAELDPKDCGMQPAACRVAPRRRGRRRGARQCGWERSLGHLHAGGQQQRLVHHAAKLQVAGRGSAAHVNLYPHILRAVGAAASVPAGAQQSVARWACGCAGSDPAESDGRSATWLRFI